MMSPGRDSPRMASGAWRLSGAVTREVAGCCGFQTTRSPQHGAKRLMGHTLSLETEMFYSDEKVVSPHVDTVTNHAVCAKHEQQSHLLHARWRSRCHEGCPCLSVPLLSGSVTLRLSQPHTY